MDGIIGIRNGKKQVCITVRMGVVVAVSSSQVHEMDFGYVKIQMFNKNIHVIMPTRQKDMQIGPDLERETRL